MNFRFVYKICTTSEWQAVKNKGQLIPSKKDLEDGYIHFSGEDQVKGTLKKFKRYPHRNKVLDRHSTPEEIEFLNQPNTSW